MAKRKRQPTHMWNVIAAGEEARKERDDHWRLPPQLLFMILQVLIESYHAFSDLDQSHAYGDSWQALQTIIRFASSRNQWRNMIMGDDIMNTTVHGLARRASCVKRWDSISLMLRAPVTAANQPGMPFNCEEMPHNLTNRLVQQVAALCDALYMPLDIEDPAEYDYQHVQEPEQVNPAGWDDDAVVLMPDPAGLDDVIVID